MLASPRRTHLLWEQWNESITEEQKECNQWRVNNDYKVHCVPPVGKKDTMMMTVIRMMKNASVSECFMSTVSVRFANEPDTNDSHVDEQ